MEKNIDLKKEIKNNIEKFKNTEPSSEKYFEIKEKLNELILIIIKDYCDKNNINELTILYYDAGGDSINYVSLEPEFEKIIEEYGLKELPKNHLIDEYSILELFENNTNLNIYEASDGIYLGEKANIKYIKDENGKSKLLKDSLSIFNHNKVDIDFLLLKLPIYFNIKFNELYKLHNITDEDFKLLESNSDLVYRSYNSHNTNVEYFTIYINEYNYDIEDTLVKIYNFLISVFEFLLKDENLLNYLSKQNIDLIEKYICEKEEVLSLLTNKNSDLFELYISYTKADELLKISDFKIEVEESSDENEVILVYK